MRRKHEREATVVHQNKFFFKAEDIALKKERCHSLIEINDSSVSLTCWERRNVDAFFWV